MHLSALPYNKYIELCMVSVLRSCVKCMKCQFTNPEFLSLVYETKVVTKEVLFLFRVGTPTEVPGPGSFCVRDLVSSPDPSSLTNETIESNSGLSPLNKSSVCPRELPCLSSDRKP